MLAESVPLVHADLEVRLAEPRAQTPAPAVNPPFKGCVLRCDGTRIAYEVHGLSALGPNER